MPGGAGGPDGPALPRCALCGRPVPPHARQSRHHLVPRLKGGRRGPAVLMHAVCHNEIHAVLTEAELARAYASIEALRGHPKLARFIRWIATRPADFHARTRPSRRLRRR